MQLVRSSNPLSRRIACIGRVSRVRLQFGITATGTSKAVFTGGHLATDRTGVQRSIGQVIRQVINKLKTAKGCESVHKSRSRRAKFTIERQCRNREM